MNLNFKRQDILAKNKLAKVEFKKSIKENDSLVFVGKPLDISENWPEVRNYADRVNHFVQVLYQDQRNQIVYQDVKELEDVSGSYGSGALASVSVLKSRAESRGPNQTTKDLDWDNKFNPFYIEWTKWYDNVKSVSPGSETVFTPASAWEQLQNFESRLRDLTKSFSTLGGTKLTEDISKVETLESPSGKKEDITGVPTWVYWAVGGVILVVLAVVFAPSINAITVAGTRFHRA